MKPFGCALGGVAVACLSACSTPAAPIDAGAESRILVKLVHPASDPAAIAREVARAAGVPARYVASTSPQWHALALRCGAPRDCEAALGRLRADRALVEAVQGDERRRIVTP
jgi:hypothetical protein